ncbi:MAG: division/cell wall cluster transcriptional repressor MraZ [Dehalococcoidia bacterium]
MAFRGTYEHTLDDRGRVAIPARYRHLFSDGAILVQGEDGCVEVYNPRDYEITSEAYTAEPVTTKHGRHLRRIRYAPAFDAELDRQGRVLVPSFLRQWGDLNGSVIINGRGDCLEIWNPQRWAQEMGWTGQAETNE